MSGYGDVIASFLGGKLKTMSGDVYNEFSLQFELACHLREMFNDRRLLGMPAGNGEAEDSRMKVLFERNVRDMWPERNGEGFTKKEIDLSIMKGDVPECAIELKYPRNGQYPEEMFSFCEDIRFLEELRKAGFREAYAVCLVDDPTFCNRDGRQRRIDGIYAPFRDGKPIHGLIEKPTGDCSRVIEVEGEYNVDWHDTGDGRWYYVIAM